MTDIALMKAMLDNLKHPYVFADAEHVIRYLNPAAEAHYERGQELVGTSLLDCHDKHSQKVIIEVVAALKAGEEERLVADSKNRRIFMRAVRGADREFLGYYERYEPPRK